MQMKLLYEVKLVMNKALLEYLPPILQNVYELSAICAAQTPTFLEIEKAIETVLNNQFVESADISSIIRYEKMMGISPRGTDTLEDRRFRLKNRIMGDLPYTQTALQHKLSTLCGENGFSLSIDYTAYVIKVKLELTAKNQMDEVKSTLADMLPANMLYDVSIRYNQHYKLAVYTHSHLAAKTHETIRNEVLS